MKKIIILCICAFVFILSFSCKKGISDFLDKPPGVDVTEDTIFSNKAQIETFLVGAYGPGVAIHSDPNMWMWGSLSGSSDEGKNSQSWQPSNLWNTGDINANDIVGWGEDFMFYNRWGAVRKANILIERIEGVAAVDQGYKDEVMGQAKFIRALAFFEMLKRYGGVPITPKRFNAGDDLKIPRSSVEDVVNFIVTDCTDAAALLPSKWPTNYTGKVTKGAALMLKAKTLLYAASPLFNTATPYLEFGSNNKFICYGNFDANRWQLAADAYKAVIDWAPSGGIALITDKGVDKNYQYAWEVPDNSEIILAEQFDDGSNFWSSPYGNLLPQGMYYSWGGITVPLNFVKFYDKKDGTPQSIWNPAGGDNLNEKYAELDPRFAQTMAYNGSYWNNDYPVIQTFEGGAEGNFCYAGVWAKKPIISSYRYPEGGFANWIEFGLAEAYVSYAEALNEAQGPTQPAYDAMNTVRARSGMPPIAGLSKDQFRTRIHTERAIELAYNDQRFWDIRRYMIAEQDGVMKGDMWGIKVTPIAGSTDFHYQPWVFETRSFVKKEYLHPWVTSEVNKGYFVQNPGW